MMWFETMPIFDYTEDMTNKPTGGEQVHTWSQFVLICCPHLSAVPDVPSVCIALKACVSACVLTCVSVLWTKLHRMFCVELMLAAWVWKRVRPERMPWFFQVADESRQLQDWLLLLDWWPIPNQVFTLITFRVTEMPCVYIYMYSAAGQIMPVL